MSASRTGTTKWKQIVARAKRRARRNGQLHCLECSVTLDYDVSRLPNSAEGDHIVPWSLGGADSMSNVRIICRSCNQSIGGKVGRENQKKRRPIRKPQVRAVKLSTSRQW